MDVITTSASGVILSYSKPKGARQNVVARDMGQTRGLQLSLSTESGMTKKKNL